MNSLVHPLSRCICPFASRHTEVCEASLSSMSRKTSTRQTWCDTENYDNCPIFLARVLRKG